MPKRCTNVEHALKRLAAGETLDALRTVPGLEPAYFFGEEPLSRQVVRDLMHNGYLLELSANGQMTRYALSVRAWQTLRKRAVQKHIRRKNRLLRVTQATDALLLVAERWEPLLTRLHGDVMPGWSGQDVVSALRGLPPAFDDEECLP